MAWSRANTINKLIVQVAGTNYEETLIDSPDITTFQQNNLNSMGPYDAAWASGLNVSGYTNWGSTSLDRYNQIEALTTPTGGLSLLAYMDLAGNGNYFYVYREEYGINNRLEIARLSGSDGKITEFRIRAVVNGTTLGQVMGWAGNTYVSSYLGFMSDGTNYIPYARMLIDPVDTGSHGIHNQCDCAVPASFNTNNRQLLSALIQMLVIGNTPPTPPGPSENPYSDGSFSEPSGDPTGDYDDTSDVISVPSVPSFNLGITSLINVWVPYKRAQRA